MHQIRYSETRGVTLRKVGWGCAARFPKPYPVKQDLTKNWTNITLNIICDGFFENDEKVARVQNKTYPKAIPLGAAHIYIAHISQGSIPPLPPSFLPELDTNSPLGVHWLGDTKGDTKGRIAPQDLENENTATFLLPKRLVFFINWGTKVLSDTIQN